MTHKPSVDLTVLIPCYNEEESIKECVMRIPNMPWSTEILVVDDGSSDNTIQVARSITKDNLHVIACPKSQNHGKGRVCRVGVQHARGRVIVIQDVDMNPEDIPAVVRPIFEGKADFVNGTRMLLPMEPGSMTRLNKFGNKYLFAVLVSLLIRKRLTDTLCGYKAFHTTLLRGKLKENDWPDFEMIVKAKRAGARIAEVPISYVARKHGVSKMKPFKHGWRMLTMLLRLLVRR